MPTQENESHQYGGHVLSVENVVAHQQTTMSTLLFLAVWPIPNKNLFPAGLKFVDSDQPIPTSSNIKSTPVAHSRVAEAATEQKVFIITIRLGQSLPTAK